MTKNEIAEHRDRKVSLIADTDALEKLRTYLAECKLHANTEPDSQTLIEGLEDEIADMEVTIQKRTEELKDHENSVRIALKTMSDRTGRVAASLYYCNGLSWAEVGSILHMSEAAIKSRVYRALIGAGILWEK